MDDCFGPQAYTNHCPARHLPYNVAARTHEQQMIRDDLRRKSALLLYEDTRSQRHFRGERSKVPGPEWLMILELYATMALQRELMVSSGSSKGAWHGWFQLLLFTCFSRNENPGVENAPTPI